MWFRPRNICEEVIDQSEKLEDRQEEVDLHINYDEDKLPAMINGEKIRIGYILRKIMSVAYLRAFSTEHKITFDCYMTPGEDPDDKWH